MNEATDRLAVIGRAIQDPPRVHDTDQAWRPPGGIWPTDRECYELLAEHCPPGTRTLETGIGISTLLFTLWGCEHTCVTPFDEERDIFVSYCNARRINLQNIRIRVEPSDTALPGMTGELDVVFVDGGHGFPTPVLDWYYASGRLRDRGILVLDDTNLPSAQLGLLPFLDADPRWIPIRSTAKWRAYRRNGSWSLGEEWVHQPFFSVALEPRGMWRGEIRPFLGRLRRAITS